VTATAVEPIAPTGLVIPPLVPGSPEWLRKMSASKVAAALGLSTFESPFSLYHRMTGAIPPEPENDQHRRGHYLEPAVVAWFADQHPDWHVAPGKCWRHRDHDWYTASPDRLVVTDSGDTEVVEVKTAADSDEWGEAGSDEIPAGYRAQVVCELDVVGVRRAHVAVLLPYLEFRAYVIEYDPAEATFIRDAAAAFMRRVETGDRPDIDSHDQTYEAVRRLHPDIDRVDVELDPETALASSADLGRARRAPKHYVKQARGDADRIARLALTVVRQDPKLAECSPESFAGALLTASALGLEPGVNGEAYLVPTRRECTLIVGYQGYAKLFWQHPLAKHLDAQAVHANDEFDYAYGLEPYLTHKPAKGDRGPVIALLRRREPDDRRVGVRRAHRRRGQEAARRQGRAATAASPTRCTGWSARPRCASSSSCCRSRRPASSLTSRCPPTRCGEVETVEGHGFGPFEVRGAVVDPLCLDKRLDRYRKGKRTLTVACAHYQVALGEAHTSRADALAAARLAWRMMSHYPELRALSLAELHDAQIGWYAEQAEGLAAYFWRKGNAEHVDKHWPLRPYAEAAAVAS
jgi:putative phage-type endonuclease